MHETACEMTYEIKSIHGHFEVYANGEFICSTDTIGEAVKEIESLRREVS